MSTMACSSSLSLNARTLPGRSVPPTGRAAYICRRRRPSHVTAVVSTDKVEAEPAVKKEAAESFVGDMERGNLAEESGRSDGELTARWKEMHGCNNWDGLLDPIDRTLRGELIRYGEFVVAASPWLLSLSQLTYRGGRRRRHKSFSSQRTNAGAARTASFLPEHELNTWHNHYNVHWGCFIPRDTPGTNPRPNPRRAPSPARSSRVPPTCTHTSEHSEPAMDQLNVLHPARQRLSLLTHAVLTSTDMPVQHLYAHTHTYAMVPPSLTRLGHAHTRARRVRHRRRGLFSPTEFSQACYDSFDYDRFSRYAGSCKFPKDTFFHDVGLSGVGYDVARYLYATSHARFPSFGVQKHNPCDERMWSETGTFIGFVAVSTDEETARIGRRDIAVSWRGTVTKLEWIADITAFLKPIGEFGLPCPDPNVKVEEGFAELYTSKNPNCKYCKYSAREQVLAEVRKLVDRYTGQGEEVSITVTGHSLGSALAMLCAYDIAETRANVSTGGAKAPVCVFSYSGPRVGNPSFRERFEGELGVKALRILNVHDSVPKVPGIFTEAVLPMPFQRLLAHRRRAGPRPQDLAVPQGHLRPRVLPQP